MNSDRPTNISRFCITTIESDSRGGEMCRRSCRAILLRNILLTLLLPLVVASSADAQNNENFSYSYTLGSQSLPFSQSTTLGPNSGTAFLGTSVSTQSGGNWLSVDPTGGSAYFGHPVTFYVVVNPTGLAPGTYSGLVSISAFGFSTYHIGVTLEIASGPAAPPKILTQPSDLTVLAGATAKFAMAASGSPAVTSRWQRSTDGGATWGNLTDGSGIRGATTPSLTVAPTTTAMNGHQFRVTASNSEGSATSNVATLTITPPPANDYFADRILLTGASVTTTGYNSLATDEIGEPKHTGPYTGGSVWWTWTAPASGLVTINTTGSDFHAVLAVYTGSAVNGLSEIASNDSFGDSTRSSVTFSTTAGTTYQIAVAGSFYLSGSISLGLQLNSTVPLITAISVPRQIVYLGQSLTLGVSASSSTTSTYQWTRNGVSISDATSASYTITSAAARDHGWYQVVITNSAGVTTSPLIFVEVVVAGSQVVPWGSNVDGQGTVPTALTSVAAIAAGAAHTLALNGEGTIVAWGRNTEGQSIVPPGLSDVVSLAAGVGHNLALKADGTILAWGSNGVGQTSLPMTGTFVAISAGYHHSLALLKSGRVLAWGSDSDGQLRLASYGANFVAIAAGGLHSLGLRNDGTVVASGSNNFGQTTVPPTLSNVVAIAAGFYHSLALKSDGTVVAWGRNADGQSTVPPSLSGVIAIAAGDSHSLALKSDGTAVAWGRNADGQATVPPSLTNVIGIAAGGFHSVALRDTAVITAPSFAGGQPANSSVVVGYSAILNATATGYPAPAYRWQRSINSGTTWSDVSNDAIFSGATSTSLIISNATTDMSGYQFRAIASNGQLPDATSIGATLTVIVPPTISTHPQTQAVVASGSVVLSITASGSGPFTYQWLLNGVNIAGATSSTYAVPSSQRFHGGSYTVVVMANGLSTTSNAAVLTINPPPPNNARLLNLSTRGLAEAGANQLFPGFVVQGTGTKKLLIRAVGPSLADLGFPFPVTPDPRMVLKRYNFSAVPPGYEDVTTNDDWETNANAADIIPISAALGAFPLTDAKDAALLVDLAAGQYAVVAGDKNDTSGIAIVELYDADPAGAGPASALVNISNRGFAGLGAEVMIPGFVVSSEGPKTLLVRVVGPTLVGFGVPGTMADPKLAVYKHNFTTNADDLLFTNDNWSDNVDAAYTAQIAIQVSAFPLTAGAKDAAFVITLEPGVYTVVGSSADGTGTGIVLVEVYVVQ